MTKTEIIKLLLSNDTVKGCLARLRKGELFAVGVLADKLEEDNLPYAKKIRKIWEKYCADFAYWSTADLSRRRFVRWQVIGWLNEGLRRKIGRFFGKKWKRKTAEDWLKLKWK